MDNQESQMKKVIYFLSIFIVIQLSAKGLNLLSPEIHSLIGLSADDPVTLYYFHESGIFYEEFMDEYSIAGKDVGGIIISYRMPLEESLSYIDISIEDTDIAEKKLKELLDFYRIPLNFAKFDVEAYKMRVKVNSINQDSEEYDWEDFESEDFDWEAYGSSLESQEKSEDQHVWNIDSSIQEEYDYEDYYDDTDYSEDLKYIYYLGLGGYTNNVGVTYTKQPEGEYLITNIYIEGDFVESPPSRWQEAAAKYYAKLSEQEINHITDLIARSKTQHEEEARALEVQIAQVELEELEKEEQLKVDKQQMVTIWDKYLTDINDTESMMYMLNLYEITSQDVADLETKYDFQNDYFNCYAPYNEKVGIYITEVTSGKFHVDGLSFIFDENQDIPFLGINQSIPWKELLTKFGHNYYLNSWGHAYKLLASSHDPESLEIDLSLEFELNSNAKISKITLSKTNSDNFDYQGDIYFIDSGCITGNCQNGRGIYQYANGIWVDGFFRDGIPISGVPQELNFVRRDIASIDILLYGELPYKANDESLWKDYFQEDSEENYLLLFNKKDYSESDWDALRSNYFFTEDYHYFSSPDGNYEVEAAGDYSYIKSIRFKINNLDDLKKYGFSKQYSYDELTRNFGHEYYEEKKIYEAILIPQGDYSKPNHFDVDFEMSTDFNEIRYIKFSPHHPESIQTRGLVEFLPAGANPRTGIDYQWIDGYWFRGNLKGGLPWRGSIYLSFTEVFFAYISNGMMDKGMYPTILSQPDARENTVENLFDEFTGYLNDFNDAKALMLIYLADMMEDEDRIEYSSNWDNLDQYANDSKDALNDAYNTIYSLICKLDEKEGTSSAKQQARRIMTDISNLEIMIKAARNSGLRFGNGTKEDITELSNSSQHIKDIKQSHAALLQELKNCGYF
jgi:hypothetical protein